MDRLLAGPPATIGRATFGNGSRAGDRAGPAVREAGPPLSSRHAGSARAACGIGRASVQPAFMAIGVCAIQDTKKEDFLDKTTTAPAEFVRAADAAMPLAVRAARKTAAKKPAARRTAAKKPAAKRATAAKKPAAKRASAARKPAARKTAARKPAARKTAAKKPAARKAAAKKPAVRRAVRRPRKAAAPAAAPAAPATPSEAAS